MNSIMYNLIICLIFFILTINLFSCSSSKFDCKGELLSLELNSQVENNNTLISYYKENKFTQIKDSVELLKFEKASRVSHFMQPSKYDSTIQRFKYKVKKGIIINNAYQMDLLLLIDNDEPKENIYYTLRTYDSNRDNIGHLDFAYFSKTRNSYLSGRIDCDSTIHTIDRNEHRIHKIDITGRIIYKMSTKSN